MAGIRGIFFDLGDTLLDFGPVDTIDMFEQGAKLTYAYLQERGVPLPSFSDYHRRQLRAIRWSYAWSRIRRREFNSLDIIGRLAARMGQELALDDLDEVAWRWYEPLSRQAAGSVSGRIRGVGPRPCRPASSQERNAAARSRTRW